MDDFEIMQSIQDASAILIKARQSVVNGSQTIWNTLKHAERHIDKEAQAIMAIPDDPRISQPSEPLDDHMTRGSVIR